MILKYIIFVAYLVCVSSEMRDVEEMYLNFFVQVESVKKSVDILKLRVDILSKNNCNCESTCDANNFSEVFKNFEEIKNSLDDVKSRININSNKLKIDNQENVDDTKKPEMEKDNIVLVISEVKANYSSLLNEVNNIRKSEESLKQKNSDLEAKYLEILNKFEATKKTNEELKMQMDNLTNAFKKISENDQAYENYKNNELFDVRVDKIDEFSRYCYKDPEPRDCETATKCTQKSGYYNIHSAGITVYCDMKTNGGRWLHILRRKDGSENFSRTWSEYEKGFGKLDGEYWIGLEALHILTNDNGRQELYIHIENFEGETFSILYDDFVVGNRKEGYPLKSLGKYYGKAEDDMSYNVGSKFSTIDRDNDSWPGGSCAVQRQAGWWYNYCTYVQPTGQYLQGESSRNGILWRSFNGLTYSHKVLLMMIRRA